MDKKKKTIYIREDLAEVVWLLSAIREKSQGDIISEMIEFYMKEKDFNFAEAMKMSRNVFKTVLGDTND